MVIEINEEALSSGEYDFCNCGNNGDNTILHKIKGENGFICWECWEKYEEAKQTIKEMEWGINKNGK